MKKNNLFLHMPKCAGMSVELISYDIPNIYICAINRTQQWIDDDPIRKENFVLDFNKLDYNFSFSFVRNPYDRAVSSYYWTKTHHTMPYYKDMTFKSFLKDVVLNPSFFDNIKTNRDINYFIKNYLYGFSNYSFFMRSHFMPFTDPQLKLFNSSLDQTVDYIGKVETFNEDLRSCFNKMNIELPEILHENASEGRKDYREYYDEECLEIVSNVYKNDIEKFGYEFS
tara:strand:+ start:793 stop:1470 length:678 start_codon:yes stop_codon:yes gene_type:complete